MSQITIVDEVLDFTEIAAAPEKRSYADDQVDYQGEEVPLELETGQEEAQRVAHALTSILISGRLPQ
ncbi:MAG: hypothetical protein JWQ10_642 [Herbaspirillum sp.]|nr:hypothetical protein [Herbaspirillum sp.]